MNESINQSVNHVWMYVCAITTRTWDNNVYRKTRDLPICGLRSGTLRGVGWRLVTTFRDKIGSILKGQAAKQRWTAWPLKMEARSLASSLPFLSDVYSHDSNYVLSKSILKMAEVFCSVTLVPPIRLHHMNLHCCYKLTLLQGLQFGLSNAISRSA